MKFSKKHFSVGALLLLFSSIVSAQNGLPQLGKNPISEVIKAMTLEEKANFVVGNGFYLPELSKMMPDMLKNVRPEQKKIVGATGSTHGIPRLGIPTTFETDGPSGVNIYYQPTLRTYYTTAWPSPTLQACTWNTEMIKRVGTAYGHEGKEYGVDIALAPALNIHRNPLCGRNFEYYSEDPLVSGCMAAAMVNGIQSNGIGTSIKHFAANNQETNRGTVNAIVSERALREIYLRGFEIAVKESNPWTIMSSYNKINGTYTSQSKDLLTTILRNEWGFKGFVMTDWYGGDNVVAQMNAGNNLIMPGTPEQATQIIDAVKSGTLKESILDENVAGILKVMELTPSFKKYQYSDYSDLYKDAQLAREVATEGIVLLKNNGEALPISNKSHIISVFGINAYDINIAGTGSGTVNHTHKVNLVEGLVRSSYTLENKLNKAYSTYVGPELLKRPKKSFIQQFANPYKAIVEYSVDSTLIKQSADASDLAIISIGRVSGEGADRKVEDLYLNDVEKQLIKKVSDVFHAQGKKVVVVLNVGAVMDVAQWRDQVDAILISWLPGVEGGNAIADVLSGKVNPSGKLATTFPISYNDDPTSKNFPGKTLPVIEKKKDAGPFAPQGDPSEVVYEEGIYVGYRYYNTFDVKTAYEFGFGLSYTNFDYSPVKLSASTFDGKLTATLTITNAGKVAGKEVVQLYLSAPTKKMDKPSEELKGFIKTGLLEPGKSQTITFTLNSRDLASYNTAGSSWVADAGQYKIKIGASSLNIKSTGIFSLPKDILVEKANKALTPQVKINELKSKKGQ